MNKPRTLDNMEVQTFLSQFTNYSDLPSWMDDVIRGAVQQARTTTGTGTIPKTTLFRLLQSLGEISVDNVMASYNRKREALGYAPVTVRMGQYVARAAFCASQAIHYHIENHDCSLYQEQIPEMTDKQFTEEQREALRKLAISGNSASFVETFNQFKTA